MTNPLRMTHGPARRPDRRHQKGRTPTSSTSSPTRCIAADHLGDVADHLIGHFVDQARRSGASWTDIGKSMGVTKQAAQKRFVPKDPIDRRTSTPSQGFAGSPTRARNVVVAAQNEAATPATTRSGPSTWCSGCSSEPDGLAAHGDRRAGRTAGGRPRRRRSRRCRRRRANCPPLVPFDRGAQGAGAHLPRGPAAGPQLRRDRAHPARAAGARGRRGRTHRSRDSQGRGRRADCGRVARGDGGSGSQP